MAHISRISSFDAGQEQAPHFIAAMIYSMHILEKSDVLIITQGTDSMVNKAALFAATLSPYLFASHKKIIFIGSPESGYIEDSLAIPNITAGLYAGLEHSIPGGVYLITAIREENDIFTHILPGLSSVKLHTDGLFYAPNTGSIITIHKRTIHKTSLYRDLFARVKNIGLLPYLSNFYLKDSAIDRLENAFKLISIETIDNDAELLKYHYLAGKRVYLIRARGAGNAPQSWKEAIRVIVEKKDTTVMIVTMADSGDVNLEKYAAGLALPEVLSGRTLREEAAQVLVTICHDLKQNEGYLFEDLQQLIDRYCYLSCME